MIVKIKRIDKNLPLPQYQTKGAVGFDLYSRLDAVIKPKEYVALPSNLIIETPKGYMWMVAPRSSLFKKKGLILPNSVAIVDNDFCGDEDEFLFQLYNISDKEVKIEKGERIAQGIFVKVDLGEWEEVEIMENETRNGIGSTG